MTMAVNRGYVISRNPDARRAWELRREARAPQTQSVAEYRATTARLAARFPDAVKLRVH